MYAKGADSGLFELLVQGKINETFEHIHEYATHGLRTLVIAYKELTQDEFNQIEAVLNEAEKTLEDRKEAVSICI